jgi:hypothetical protein
MDKNDLAALLVDASADEVDRIHRLLHEWSVGPDNSFPVQLALLTKAQWRIAATLPRLMNESRKLLEIQLGEYRRQTQALLDNLSATAQKQIAELKTVVESHAQSTGQAARQVQAQLDDAKAVAKQIKSLMETAASEWSQIKGRTTAQCTRLEQVSKDLEDRFAWRVIIWWAVCIVLAVGLGYSFGIMAHQPLKHLEAVSGQQQHQR